eukprot:m.290702 g.290702  ORF g.290702 m.290702 type:complete len:709 (-) comp15817_c0_seq3:3164-5290(-)
MASWFQVPRQLGLVLLCMFLVGFVEAFAMNAFGYWLQYDIGIEPAAQSTFYATIFIPWALKPLYAWLSDSAPVFGRRRKPYLMLASLLSASLYLTLAFAVHTSTGALYVTLLRTASNACVEILLGVMLVEYAASQQTETSRGVSTGGKVQSLAAGVRASASIIALSAPTASVEPITILASAAAAPLAVFVACFFLDDTMVADKSPASALLNNNTDDSDTERERERASVAESIQASDAALPTTRSMAANPNASVVSSAELSALAQPTLTIDTRAEASAQSNAPQEQHQAPLKAARLAYHMTVLAILLLVAWASLKSLLSQRAWLHSLAGVAAIDLVILGGAMYSTRALRRSLRAADSSATTAHTTPKRTLGLAGAVAEMAKTLWPGLILFIANSCPTVSSPIMSYMYALWTPNPESGTNMHVQMIFLSMSVSRLLSSAITYLLLRSATQRRLRITLILSFALAAVTTLMYLPIIPSAHGIAPVTPSTTAAFSSTLSLATTPAAIKSMPASTLHHNSAQPHGHGRVHMVVGANVTGIQATTPTLSPLPLNTTFAILLVTSVLQAGFEEVFTIACLVIATNAGLQALKRALSPTAPIGMTSSIEDAQEPCPVEHDVERAALLPSSTDIPPKRDASDIQHGALYALFLSLFDFGDSVGGWISTPLASRLNISFDNYQGVSTMIYVCVGIQLFVALCVLPLLPTKVRRLPQQA